MKITHITGDVVDTDKLNDIDAAILEKTEELRTFCTTANRPFLCFVDCKKPNETLTTFWNFKTDTNPSQEQINLAYEKIFKSINSYLHFVTDGRLGIMRLPNSPDDESDNEE